MISELSMHVVPKNKNGTVAFLISMSAGVILTVISGRLEAYRGVVGLVGLVFFAVALYIYVRYVVREYYYDITVADGEPLLVVRQFIGKRGTVMCRISLVDVEKVEFLTRSTLRETSDKLPTEFKKFNYTVALAPIVYVVRLTVCSRYEKSLITLEGGRELAELLEKYVSEAKGMMQLDNIE